MAVISAKKSTKRAPKAAPAEQPSDATEGSGFANVIRLTARKVFVVKQFVSKVQLRTLVGREIVGIAPHADGDGKMVPVYDVDKTGWLDKWFAFEVPMAVNDDGTPKVYDLSGRAVAQATHAIHIESGQVRVWKDADGVFQIHKHGHGEMIEHFGGTKLKRGADGTLAEVTVEDAESF